MKISLESLLPNKPQRDRANHIKKVVVALRIAESLHPGTIIVCDLPPRSAELMGRPYLASGMIMTIRDSIRASFRGPVFTPFTNVDFLPARSKGVPMDPYLREVSDVLRRPEDVAWASYCVEDLPGRSQPTLNHIMRACISPTLELASKLDEYNRSHQRFERTLWRETVEDVLKKAQLDRNIKGVRYLRELAAQDPELIARVEDRLKLFKEQYGLTYAPPLLVKERLVIVHLILSRARPVFGKLRRAKDFRDAAESLLQLLQLTTPEVCRELGVPEETHRRIQKETENIQDIKNRRIKTML